MLMGRQPAGCWQNPEKRQKSFGSAHHGTLQGSTQLSKQESSRVQFRYLVRCLLHQRRHFLGRASLVLAHSVGVQYQISEQSGKCGHEKVEAGSTAAFDL